MEVGINWGGRDGTWTQTRSFNWHDSKGGEICVQLWIVHVILYAK